MSEKLRVELVAEVQKFQKGLKQAEKKLLQFDKQAGRGSKGFDKIGKSSANAVPAVNEFSRVIQDAPFGIQGVANNITQLTQSFGYLQKSTGSSKAALKAMLSTLTGPAGILLAVSAVTSLLVSFGDELFNTSKQANKLIDAQKDLVGSAQSEIATLSSLLGIAKDENQSKVNRERAIKKINSLYKDYLPNLDLENINTNKVKTATDALTKSLIRQAKIKGLSSRISELYAERFEKESKGIKEQVGFFTALGLKLKNFGNLQGSVSDAVEIGSNRQAKAIKKIDDQITKVTESLGELLGEDIQLGGIETGTKDTGVAQKVGEKVTSAFSQISIKGLKALEPLTQIGTQISTSLGEGTAAIRGGSVEMINALTELSNGVSNIVSTNLIGAFSGIGEAIGTALSEGKNLGNELATALLSSVGSLLVQLGQLAIAIGVGLKAIKAAFTSLNPLAAIGAGVGLIALGSLFKGASKKIGGSIGGGSNTGFSTSTSTQTSSGGSFTSGFSGNGGGTVVFEIAGTKLVGVLSNTLRQNRNLGGTLKFD